MRKFLHLLLFFLALIPLRTYSQSAVIDNVTYLLDTSTHEATANAYNGTEETLDIPETIEYDGEAYAITTLGNLLYNDTIVKQLTLPITITKIRFDTPSQRWPFKNCVLEEIDMSHLNISTIGSFDQFFYGCANLKSIKMPQTSKPIGSYMCQGCTALESITFSPETTSIGTYAFDGCTKLYEANINELTNLTSIGEYAFQNTNLSSELILPESLTSLGKHAFSGNANLPSVKFNSKLTNLADHVFSGCTSLKEIYIPENIVSTGISVFSGCTALQSVTLPSAFTTIGFSTFSGCSALESINFPESLTSIDTYAFKSCEALTSVDMSNCKVKSLNYTFDGCSSLETVSLPATLISIGENVFYGCSALPYIDMSQTKVANISSNAFRKCTLLTTVDIPNTLASIGQYTFQGSGITSVTFPESLRTVGAYAFSGCPALEYVDMSQSKVTTLPLYVFNECSALKTVLLPSTLTSINDHAFYNTRIKNLTLPVSLKTLGANVFQNCTSLESIDMSETNVTEIPQYAFSGCTALSTVGFPSALVSLGEKAFYNSRITTVELPATVKSIGSNVFEGCKSLTSADLSKTAITNIGNYTFSNCSKLTSVLLPKNITTIGIYAFQGTALPSFTMPETVTTLGSYAFYNCTALKTVDLSNSKLTSIQNSIFSGCTALTDIDFPKTITTLGKTIFSGCKALKTVDMSKTQLTSIPASTFSGLTALNTVKLPETVTTLGASCFASSGITAIVSGDNKAADGCVNLPSGLKSFPATAITGCTKLTTLDLGGLATDPKFSYTVLSSFTALTKFVFPKNSDLSALTRKSTSTAYLPSTTAPLSVTLPSGESTPTIPNYFFYNINLGEVIFDDVPPTAIGNYAFANNPLCGVATEDGSTVFRIPDGVQTIGSNTFSGTAAKHLVADSICLSGTLTSIGSSAFTNNQCKVLVFETPVTPATAADMSHAPARVSSTPSLEIGSQAFSSTTGGPETVICHHSVPPTLPDNGFSMAQYSDGELVVGYRSANAYRTATGWKNFSDNLVTGIEEVGIDTDIDNDNNLTRSDDGRTYNLMGMPVSTDRPLAPGIYIRNGKKIYIR
ncbi:MAG: leucine-rich repeat protein [Barnesiella sp.]|nr:leucine-rich repeat protein [Barnesiella sp.]